MLTGMRHLSPIDLLDASAPGGLNSQQGYAIMPNNKVLFSQSPTPSASGAKMLTQSLPAASLRTGNLLPADRVLVWVSNYLICMALWLIGPAISGLESSFLPALREGPGGVRRATRQVRGVAGQRCRRRKACDIRPASVAGSVELIAGHLMVRLDATAISVASLPGPPTIDRPTGKPSTVAPGM